MSNESAMSRVLAAYKGIEEADAEAARLKREARIAFGRVVNEEAEARRVKQEEVASAIGKTREYVRRLQVDARNA